MADVLISLVLPPAQAVALAQVVKRLARSNLGRDGVNLATPTEEQDAEQAINALAVALRAARWDLP
jgi:hypothetical protein